MGILNTINTYYIANGAFLWESLAKYFGMLIIPFVMLVGIGIVHSITDRDGRSNVHGIFNMLSFIVWGFILICLVKFIIVFGACGISWIYRLF